MRLSKAQVQSRVHAIPVLRFEDQRLTSFAGAVLLQALFQRMDLKARLLGSFPSGDERRAYGRHVVMMTLVVHLLLGFRQLRDRDYYCDDPLVWRLLGVRRVPDVSTICRTLSSSSRGDVQRGRRLSRGFVLERLRIERLARLTMDFDGSVLSTRRHAEGTAVGFNRKHKGARSYYPLFCTVAQTGQFLDFHHRPGNVHDSNGALQFIRECADSARQALPGVKLESRLDSAFFSDALMGYLVDETIEFTASLPFERFAELRGKIERRRAWEQIDATWSCFELNWKPKSWNSRLRVLVFRKRVVMQRKGPLQLDLFEPRDYDFEYKAVVTNKTESPNAVLRFHNGRGSQEGLLGQAKEHAQMEFIPSRRLVTNELVLLASLMAHNISRELQMVAKPRVRATTPERRTLWDFETLGTVRHRLLQRAGRLTSPAGVLTLTMSANEATRQQIGQYLSALQQAA